MTIPIILLALHFLGDFLLQSDWMALNKSKRWDALTAHAVVYAWCFIPYGFTFYILTFLTHFLTDAITSRITSRLWFVRLIEPVNGPGERFYGAYEPRKRHWFFVVIGADQLIHFLTLALTYHLLFK